MSRRNDLTPALWGEDYGGILRPDTPPAPAPAASPRASHDGPETSRAAARSMRQAAPTIRERVRHYIADRGPAGATCEATVIALRLRTATSSARCRELAQSGLIRDTGSTSATTSGRQARVYVATGEEVRDG